MRPLQLRVFRPGGDEDEKVRIGVFPQDEEVLVGSSGFRSITAPDVRIKLSGTIGLFPKDVIDVSKACSNWTRTADESWPI